MASLIVLLSITIPMLLVLACLVVWRVWRRRDRRRSRLNHKVINVPGEGLRKMIARHAEAYGEAAAVSLVAGPIMVAAWSMSRLSRVVPDWTKIQFGTGDMLFVVCLLLLLGWSVSTLIRHSAAARKYREGLAAELTVAQCLMPLAADGAVVFHDFPGDKFNIDHIVIGRGAVFAVETKSRKKPPENGRDSARVTYDGARLQFPAHAESAPIEQAAFQAKWLERFLASGVGETVRVIPVLALPGWFIENSAPRSEVLVSNCRNPGFMMGDKFGSPISEVLRRRIAHVLSERYPPIEL